MNLVLSLTHQCNLRCRYCYAGARYSRRMTPEIMEKALDLAFSLNQPLLRVMPFGGEPLLELDLLETLALETRRRAEVTGKRAQLGVTTNGTLLTDRALDLLERHRFELAVSIDGTQEAHDAARVFADGRGSFELVRQGLERAMRRWDAIRTVSVVHPGNVEQLAESFTFLSSLGIRQLSFSVDYGSRWLEADVARLEEALEALAERAMARYRAGQDFTVQPLHGKIISQLKGGYAPSDRCEFGCMEVAVAPSGRLYPCDRLIGEDGPSEAEVCIGHVESGMDTAKVLALREAKDRVKPECEGCALVERCRWWCGCVNRARTGRVDTVDGFLCTLEQLTVRAADRMASTLYAEGNPTFLRRYYIAASAATARYEAHPRAHEQAQRRDLEDPFQV